MTDKVIIKLYKKFENWFDINLGWFFVNGNKHNEYKNYLKERYGYDK